jgi:hypothetical protein
MADVWSDDLTIASLWFAVANPTNSTRWWRILLSKEQVQLCKYLSSKRKGLFSRIFSLGKPFVPSFIQAANAGDTLSSRHLISRDVTSAVGIFDIEFWRTLTLLSLCLRHVIWRGALVGWHASTPLKFLLAHSFRETWRTSRLTKCVSQQKFKRRAGMWADQNSKSDHVT